MSDKRVYATIVIDDEPVEALAFKKASSKFEDEERSEIETEDENIWRWSVVLTEKEYVHDEGDKYECGWRYTFEIREE